MIHRDNTINNKTPNVTVTAWSATSQSPIPYAYIRRPLARKSREWSSEKKGTHFIFCGRDPPHKKNMSTDHLAMGLYAHTNKKNPFKHISAFYAHPTHAMQHPSIQISHISTHKHISYSIIFPLLFYIPSSKSASLSRFKKCQLIRSNQDFCTYIAARICWSVKRDLK